MAVDTHGSRPGDNEVTPKEVAVFIDFENIRYSTINSFGREPDPLSWRDKALQYGLMSVARAYADFDQHPPHVRTRLDVAGFELHHYPVKRSRDATGRDKITSRSDLNLVIDIINTALVRPDIEIFLLFTGDKDFIRLVTSLRNRLGKRVVICGVPGSISPDLVAAAGESDTIEMTQSADVDVAVIQAIDTYIRQLHEGFVPTQSHMSRTLWRFLDRNRLPSEHIEAKVMEFLRKGILTKRQTINGQGQELVTTELNAQHPLVIQAIPDLASSNGTWADDDRDEDYLSDDEEDAVPDESEVAAAGAILETAAVDAPGMGNGLREPARYQRRFTTGNGAWRGRSNVRGDATR